VPFPPEWPVLLHRRASLRDHRLRRLTSKRNDEIQSVTTSAEIARTAGKLATHPSLGRDSDQPFGTMIIRRTGERAEELHSLETALSEHRTKFCGRIHAV
jgi:hypothetical protein